MARHRQCANLALIHIDPGLVAETTRVVLRVPASSSGAAQLCDTPGVWLE